MNFSLVTLKAINGNNLHKYHWIQVHLIDLMYHYMFPFGEQTLSRSKLIQIEFPSKHNKRQ